MKHRYFPESLRFLYGICAKASLLQKLGAVKDWLEFLSSPELGAQSSGTTLKCGTIINNFQN